MKGVLEDVSYWEINLLDFDLARIDNYAHQEMFINKVYRKHLGKVLNE